MPVKDFIIAIKPRTILLLLLSIAATVAAVYLQRHVTHGCFDGELRGHGRPVLASAVKRSDAATPRLLRVQQDEGAEIQSSTPPCPKNEDLNLAASAMPWIAVLLWVGFAACLQIDFEGRRKRQRRRRRRPESEESAEAQWPPARPAETVLKDKSEQ